jgi:serine/threonine protein phosphatase PrpC
MRIQHQSRSDRGRRGNNEDAMLVRPDIGLFAVADGMGGYEGGEIASRVALESLESYFQLLGPEGQLGIGADPELATGRLSLGIRIADRSIRREAKGKLAQMGTTLACLIAQDEHVALAHVGDSRIYRLRRGYIEALTRDHSLYAEMEAAGFPGLPPRRQCSFTHVVTQALGQGPDARPDVRIEDLEEGDVLVLCSDGLSDVLDEEQIAALLESSDEPADALVEAAYTRGSTDNITVIVVRALAD